MLSQVQQLPVRVKMIQAKVAISKSIVLGLGLGTKILQRLSCT